MFVLLITIKNFICLNVLFFLSFAAIGANEKHETFSTLYTNLHEPLSDAMKYVYGEGFNKEKLQVSDLPGGFSFANLYLLSFEGKKFVLRVLDANEGIAVKRKEIIAHRYADQMEIAPALRYIEKNYAFVVMDYVEGHTLTLEDVKDKKILKNLGEAIAKIHNFDGVIPEGRILDERILDLCMSAFKKGVALPSNFRNICMNCVMQTGNENTDVVLCHGDLNPGNIIITKDKEICIIDWPLSVMENRFSDLGFFSFLIGLNKEQEKEFLQSYFGTKATKQQIKKVDVVKKKVSLLVAATWFEYCENDDEKLIPFEQRVKYLDNLLTNSILRCGKSYIKADDIIPFTSEDKQSVKLFGLGFLKTYMDWKD